MHNLTISSLVLLLSLQSSPNAQVSLQSNQQFSLVNSKISKSFQPIFYKYTKIQNSILDIKKCSFMNTLNNVLRASSMDSYFKKIYTQRIGISEGDSFHFFYCLFVNCSVEAKQEGGALYIKIHRAKILIEKCSFINCTTCDEKGGACSFSFHDKLVLNSCCFTNCFVYILERFFFSSVFYIFNTGANSLENIEICNQEISIDNQYYFYIYSNDLQMKYINGSFIKNSISCFQLDVPSFCQITFSFFNFFNCTCKSMLCYKCDYLPLVRMSRLNNSNFNNIQNYDSLIKTVNIDIYVVNCAFILSNNLLADNVYSATKFTFCKCLFNLPKIDETKLEIIDCIFNSKNTLMDIKNPNNKICFKEIDDNTTLPYTISESITHVQSSKYSKSISLSPSDDTKSISISSSVDTKSISISSSEETKSISMPSSGKSQFGAIMFASCFFFLGIVFSFIIFFAFYCYMKERNVFYYHWGNKPQALIN